MGSEPNNRPFPFRGSIGKAIFDTANYIGTAVTEHAKGEYRAARSNPVYLSSISDSAGVSQQPGMSQSYLSKLVYGPRMNMVVPKKYYGYSKVNRYYHRKFGAYKGAKRMTFAAGRLSRYRV